MSVASVDFLCVVTDQPDVQTGAHLCSIALTTSWSTLRSSVIKQLNVNLYIELPVVSRVEYICTYTAQS